MDPIKQGTVNGQPVIQCNSRLYTDLETLLSVHAIIQLLFLNLVKGATKTLQVSPARSLIDCPNGEQLKICRPSCELECYKRDSKCKTVCSTAKCVCMEGFARHNGICVPKEACQLFISKSASQLETTTRLVSSAPSNTSAEITLATIPPEMIIRAEAPPRKCRRNERFSQCVCDSTCITEKKCSACSPGCGCFPLYVRNSKGFCIPVRKCPKKSTAFNRPTPALKFAVITSTEGPTPPPLILTATTKSTKGIASHSNIRAPPAITPFIFYRHKRIERKKKALRQLLKLI